MRLRRRDARLIDRMHTEFAVVRDQLHSEITGAVASATNQLVHADEAMREREAFAAAQHELALTKALERVADALDGIGAHLQLERRDRAAQSATVEFLLRELVVAFSNPVPDGPAVLGGTIDLALAEAGALQPQSSDDFRAGRGAEIREAEPPDSVFAIGQRVEVRSRFQRRWVGGFVVADAAAHDGRTSYRLMRRLDHEQLPVSFDREDIRADGPLIEPNGAEPNGAEPPAIV